MKGAQDANTRFAKKVSPLSESEEMVVSGLADGYTIKEMAYHIKVQPSAVRVRLLRARRKLQAVNNVNLVAIFLRNIRENK